MLPVEQPFKTYTGLDGKPLDNGYVYFGLPDQDPANVSKRVTVYWDAAGTLPASQPLRTVNGYIVNDSGSPANVFFDGAYSELVRDSKMRQVFYARTSDDFSIATLVQGLFALTGASKVGVAGGGTVQDRFAHSFINVKDAPYNAKGDGITDDAAAIQKAANAAAGKALYIPGTAASYLISAAINVPNNTTIFGDGPGTVIKQASGNQSAFFVQNRIGVTIRDMAIMCDVAGNVAYNGGVYLQGSQKCSVLNVVFSGLTWAGVLVQNSSQNLVQGCRFSGWLGTIQDSADVMIYQSSHFNIVRGNECLGGGNHGIMIFDPYTNSSPTGNIVAENVVGEHTAYGICIYIALQTTAPYNTRTIIANNVISDILGSGIAGTSGAGIYVQAGNAVLVIGNTVTNCCRQTTNFDTLAMAGIAVQLGETATGLEIESVVANNIVYAARGPCFFAAASNRTFVVTGNMFKADSVANVRGEAVNIINSNAIQFNNNTIRHTNPNFYAVKLVAVDKEYSNHQFANNILNATGSAGGFLVTVSGAGSINHVTFVGNLVYGSLANPAFNFQKVNGLLFANNQADSSGIVFILQSCPKSRLSGNRMYSSSAGYAHLFVGTNTGSYVDESNDLQGLIENDAGNGTRIALYGDGAPAQSGLWDIGDTVINRSPSGTGVPDRWRCIAAGYPGTWKPTNLS